MTAISRPLYRQIERMLRETPLQCNEYRRISNMGSHFISLRPKREEKGYLFSIEIDGQVVYVHKT